MSNLDFPQPDESGPPPRGRYPGSRADRGGAARPWGEDRNGYRRGGGYAPRGDDGYRGRGGSREAGRGRGARAQNGGTGWGPGPGRRGRGPDRGARDPGEMDDHPWRRGTEAGRQGLPGQGRRAGRGTRGRRDGQWGRGGGPAWSADRMEPGGGHAGRADGLRGRLPFAGWRGGGRGGPGGPGRGGPPGPRPRRKGDWWRRWTWKKGLAVAGAACGGLVAVGVAVVGVAYSQTKVPPLRLLVHQQSDATTVYFSNGKVIGTFGQTTHQILTYNQISPVMKEAMVAAEDKNYYHEGGISFSGIFRAGIHDLFSSGGGNLQGASTITEELVKNAYQGVSMRATNGSTLSTGLQNKIKEVFIAEKLSHMKSKAWILTEYLNTVYFGSPGNGVAGNAVGGATGIGAAAETFFGVQASKLDVEQAALLASMVQQPSYYSPDPAAGAAYQALLYRYHVTLSTMEKMGHLTPQQEAVAARSFPKVHPQVNNTWSGYKGYLMQRVRYELENIYHISYQQISTGGLKVYTTYDENLLNSLYKTVKHDRALMSACNPPSYALVGGGSPEAAGRGCTHLPKYVHIGAVLIQPSTGDILAEYGGRNYAKHAYDYSMESYNQVGSSFKPYVLATAVHEGMNAMNSIMNGYSPLWIPPVGSQPPVYAKPGPVSTPPKGTNGGVGWFPVTNDDVNASPGAVNVRYAMAASLNTAFTSLYSRAGGAQVMQMAQKFGVYTGKGTHLWSGRGEVGSALGQGSLTVLEQATMIATLANNGTYVAPHAVRKIVEGPKVIMAKPQRRQVLTGPQAAEVQYAMEGDTIQGGTAPGEGMNNGQVVIAKTGTTNMAQSGFFLGAIPTRAMAVGMFVNKPYCSLPKSRQKECTSQATLNYAPPKGLQTLFGVGNLAGYGGGWPAAIWHAYFDKQFSNLQVQQWPTPPRNLGTKWNLVGPHHKHHHKPKPKPTPSPTCGPGGGNGHGHHHCFPSPPPPSPSPSPTATATATPTPSPSPTPTATSTCPPKGCPGGAGTQQSATTAAVARPYHRRPGVVHATLLVVISRPPPTPGLGLQ